MSPRESAVLEGVMRERNAALAHVAVLKADNARQAQTIRRLTVNVPAVQVAAAAGLRRKVKRCVYCAAPCVRLACFLHADLLAVDPFYAEPRPVAA